MKHFCKVMGAFGMAICLSLSAGFGGFAAPVELADIEVDSAFETETAETKVFESEMIETEVSETEIPETEITETEILETEILETEITETEITETEAIEPETEDEVTLMLTSVSVISAKGVTKGVTLTWDQVPGTTGYQIRKKNAEGKYEKLANTTKLTYTDETASYTKYSYYKVYSYTKSASGKYTYGTASKVVSGIRKLPKVKNLTGKNSTAGAKISWTAIPKASGYKVYGTRYGKAKQLIGTTTTASYTDTKAPTGGYSIYYVYPYRLVDGTKVVGAKSEKVKAKKLLPKIDTPSKCGRLKVSGTKLVSTKTGKTVQLKGISTHGMAWFPQYINNSCFKQLRNDWNVNVMRLAMYTAEYAGYCTGGDKTYLKNLVKSGVKYATDNDMYVIVDWHVLQEQDPNTYKTEAKAFFKYMAQTYKDQNNVIYEICNEPNGSATWSSIKSYATEIIKTIRTYDKNAVIIVGTPTWSQEVDKAAKSPIKGYSNIMYTLHFYAATHTQWLRDRMVSAVNAGLPIFVTEYGICDASGNGTINKTEANAWIKTMDQYGISYCAWNLSNKSETSAILKSSCQKTSGFTTTDLSASGTWLYKMLTGK